MDAFLEHECLDVAKAPTCRIPVDTIAKYESSRYNSPAKAWCSRACRNAASAASFRS